MDGTCTRKAGRWIASDILDEIMEILLLASEDRQHSTSELITAPVDTHYNFKKAADEVCRARKNIWIDAIRTMQSTTRWRRRRGP